LQETVDQINFPMIAHGAGCARSTDETNKSKWHFAALACVTILLTSCGQRRINDAIQNASNLSLVIQSRQEFVLGTNMKMTIWNFTGQKVKDLTAHLLVCTDGKEDIASESICHWGDTSPPIHGQLVFLAQGGSAFGAPDKRIPSIDLSFESGGPTSQSKTIRSQILAGPPASVISQKLDKGELAEEKIIYAEVFRSKSDGANSTQVPVTRDGLVESSQNGKAVLGIVLGWKR
jgi:hypothetical protein